MRAFPPPSVSLALAQVVLFALLPAGSWAQYNQNPETFYRAPSTVHGKTVLIPVGTVLEGRIDNSIGSLISHQGERFTVTMSSPVLANGVDVIIPSGSQILGEVVEAIPSRALPHEKGTPKPCGKLRVQISGLKTPNGMTYPMVASIAGESSFIGSRVIPGSAPTAGGVGWMGSAAGFEAVAPGMQNRTFPGMPPRVVRREEMLNDALYGKDFSAAPMQGTPLIRSLVKRNNELCIDSGSPITVRLDAPFKIGFNPAGQGVPMTGLQEDTDYISGDESKGSRRFSRGRNQSDAPTGGRGNAGAAAVDPSDSASGGAATASGNEPPAAAPPAQATPLPSAAPPAQATPLPSAAPPAQAMPLPSTAPPAQAMPLPSAAPPAQATPAPTGEPTPQATPAPSAVPAPPAPVKDNSF